jgi:hypothetical protein
VVCGSGGGLLKISQMCSKKLELLEKTMIVELDEPNPSFSNLDNLDPCVLYPKLNKPKSFLIGYRLNSSLNF